jgi:hypothetical protein
MKLDGRNGRWNAVDLGGCESSGEQHKRYGKKRQSKNASKQGRPGWNST